MIVVHILAFLTICGASKSPNATTEATCVHGKVCRCENVQARQLNLRCIITSLEDLNHHIKEPERVHTLDLSSNGLSTIPRGVFLKYISLVNLSLASNNIVSVGQDSLAGLVMLRFLDISKNPLRSLVVDPSGVELGQLQYLNVLGAWDSKWTPTVDVLSLPALQVIHGARLNEPCSKCSLIKNSSNTKFDLAELNKGVYIKGDKANCRGMKYKVSNSTRFFASYGFLPSCLDEDEACYMSQITEIPFHRCWETDNHIFNLLFVFGFTGLFLNASVFLITMTEAKLRKKEVMLIISSLAVSDFLIETYSVSLAIARKRTYIEFLDIFERFCKFAGFVWMIGMFVTITTSVLLTVERYLTIVYCMKPGFRIKVKHALLLISTSWFLALITAILPYLDIGTYTGNTLCVPLVPSRTNPHSAPFGIGITLLGIVLYLTMIPLYVRIFLFVKKSGTRMGIKREGAVAVRIALLVGSNMLFFFLPVIVTILYITTDMTKHMTPVTKEALTGGAGTICASVNSFLNPLLYAYRNDRFKQVLCRRLAIARIGTRSLPPSRSLPEPSNKGEVEQQRRGSSSDPSFTEVAKVAKVSSGSGGSRGKVYSHTDPKPVERDGTNDKNANLNEQ